MTDAYINEAMELERYTAEMGKLRHQRDELERHSEELDRRKQQEQDSHNALAHLQRFCHQVAQGLDTLNFDERQQLLRLVVENITVENGTVRVETVILAEPDNLRDLRCEPVEPSLGPDPISQPGRFARPLRPPPSFPDRFPNDWPPSETPYVARSLFEGDGVCLAQGSRFQER